MNVTLPYKVRLGLYIVNAIGSPVMAYLLAKNVIGNLEVSLWAAEMTAVFALAGMNVSPDDEL